MKRVERVPGALFGALIVAGVLMTVGLVDTPGSFDRVYPWWVDNAWASVLTASAITVLGAMLWQKRAARNGSLLVPTRAYAMELCGLVILSLALLLHASAVVLVDDSSIVNYLSMFEIGLAVGCVLQAWDNVQFLRGATKPGLEDVS